MTIEVSVRVGLARVRTGAVGAKVAVARVMAGVLMAAVREVEAREGAEAAVRAARAPAKGGEVVEVTVRGWRERAAVARAVGVSAAVEAEMVSASTMGESVELGKEAGGERAGVAVVRVVGETVTLVVERAVMGRMAAAMVAREEILVVALATVRVGVAEERARESVGEAAGKA